jgi:hypothetical protein
MAHHTAPQPAPHGLELPWYLAMAGLYFFAFGLQFALYPSLVTFILQADAQAIGLAQVAISAPMAMFLIAGGVLAERVRAGPSLAVLQAAFAVPAFAIAAVIAAGEITYGFTLLYALAMGTTAAFMLPVRDAALNGVVERDAARGGKVTLAKAATTVTVVQIGGQILGILAAQQAGTQPAPYFALMGVAMAAAAAIALRLKAPPPALAGRSLRMAAQDVRDGFAYAFKSPVMGPMLISAGYVGVFVVGSFQVLFPVIIREAYGGTPAAQAEILAGVFAIFWGASFISAAALTRFPTLNRPGLALLASHGVGALSLVSFAFDKPFWLFVAIVGVWGLATGVAMSMSRTITQSATAPAYLGRVLAIYSLGFMGGMPIGALITGAAAEMVGGRMAALIPGIGMLLAAGALTIFSPIARLDGRGRADLP